LLKCLGDSIKRLTFLFKILASAAGNQTHLDQLVARKKWILEDIVRLDRQQESKIAAAHEQPCPFYEKELRYILQSKVNSGENFFFGDDYYSRYFAPFYIFINYSFNNKQKTEHRTGEEVCLDRLWKVLKTLGWVRIRRICG